MHGTVNHNALAPYLPEGPRVGRTYPDLHEHIAVLAEAGLLVVVDEPVNKDTEIHPLVRWQYRGGIPEEQRKAFFFTRPTDATGRAYKGAVLVGGLAGNNAIYRIGFGKDVDRVGAAWQAAISSPIPPKVVKAIVKARVADFERRERR